MKYNQIAIPLAGTLLVGAAGILRADDSANNDLWPEKNRVQLGYRMGWNMSLKLKNIASPTAANNPSVNGKSYTDGFVGTDDTGNAGGLTTYWGYQNAGQVVDGNNYLVMHNSGNGQLGSALGNDQNSGMELSWDHELLRFKHVRFGIEAAFNWQAVSMQQAFAAPSGVLGADAFPLGYTPPSAPYTGTATSGPFTPLLGTTPAGLPVTVLANFDANLYGFRLGPYMDVPVNKWLLFSASAGATLTLVDSSFSYGQSYSTPGGTGFSSGAHVENFDTVFGGYAGVQATVKLTKQLNVFTGLQYQFSDSYTVRAGDKQAELDFGNAFFWTLGLSYSF